MSRHLKFLNDMTSKKKNLNDVTLYKLSDKKNN